MLTLLLCGIFGCAKVTTDDIFYRVFHGTTDQYIDIPSGNATELYKNLNSSKSTQFYIHGWNERCDNVSAIAVTSALLSRDSSNVCCLDWRKPASENYISAASSTQDVATIFAKDISGMSDMGFEPGKMSIRGFSLGAHIAGGAGKDLQVDGYPNIGQITAVDAALPLMYPPMRLDCHHLEPTDADMVWAIHTCGGTYGVLEPTAQVDIYPNYGTPIQTGCPIIPETFDLTQIMPTHRCNHDRSWKFFVDAIMHPNSHICVKCDSSESFAANSCRNNTRMSIDMDMPKNMSGSCYYMTNAQYPYGRGEQGTNPSRP